MKRLFLGALGLILLGTTAYADSCRVTVTYKRPDNSMITKSTCVPNGGPQCDALPGHYCAATTDPGIAGKSCSHVPRC